MRWSVVTQPDPLITWAQLKTHLRLDVDDERDYVLSLLASATAHAEQAMEASLGEQVITAVYEAGDDHTLPRGPVTAITTVTDANSAAITASLYRVGNSDRFELASSPVYPLTVQYTAGHATVPADIINAIRVHVATLYAWREDAAPVSVSTVHKLDAFYRNRSRNPGVF